MPRKKATPAAPEPKKFGFHHVTGDEYLPYHCGPTAIRTASGRDDLSVMDCAIPVMRWSVQMSDYTDTPGTARHLGLRHILGHSGLGFDMVHDLSGKPFSEVVSELAERGYTHGTIETKGHITGFRDGVIYDTVPLDTTEVMGVMAGKSAPDATRQDFLDQDIQDGKLSGLGREYCLKALEMHERDLADVLAAEYVPTPEDAEDVSGNLIIKSQSVMNETGLSEEEIKGILTAISRYRVYCDKGEFGADKGICEDEIEELNESLRLLKGSTAEPYILAELEWWRKQCEDAVAEDPELAKAKWLLELKKWHSLTSLAYREEQSIEELPPGITYRRLLREIDDSYTTAHEAQWRHLRAQTAGANYTPTGATIFDPPNGIVDVKPKVVDPQESAPQDAGVLEELPPNPVKPKNPKPPPVKPKDDGQKATAKDVKPKTPKSRSVKPSTWIDKKKLDDFQDPRALAKMFQGTASGEEGFDLDSPLLSPSKDVFSALEALDRSFRGYTVPGKINLGAPRYYQVEAVDPDTKVLNIVSSKAWQDAYADVLQDIGDDFPNADAVLPAPIGDDFPDHLRREKLWQELYEEAKATAAARGYEFFSLDSVVRGKDEPDDVDGGGMLFATHPESVRVTYESKSSVMPGVEAPPEERDLVLYHGGARKYGVVALEHRATGGNDGVEAVPALSYTPAIWAVDDAETAETYSEGSNDTPSSDGTEPQVYYLDAPGAQVLEVRTSRLSQRQANAVLRHILNSDDWAGRRPDVLKLERTEGEEYFIPEWYEPGLVRVINPASHKKYPVDMPPVVGGGIPFREPSNYFCEVMQEEVAERIAELERPSPDLESELAYWTERCESGRPALGKDGVDRTIEALEEIERRANKGAVTPTDITPDTTDAAGRRRQLAITRARLNYWRTYKDNLEKTKKGYRLKDSAALENQGSQLLESVYNKAAAPPKSEKATVKPKTPAKPKAAAPVKATAKKAVKATAAATKAAAKPKPKVAAKKGTAKVVKAKSPAAPKAGDAPARRRTPKKEPVVAGVLPTVTISKG